MNYDRSFLIEGVKRQLNQRLEDGADPGETNEILKEFERTLRSYTYFNG